MTTHKNDIIKFNRLRWLQKVDRWGTLPSNEKQSVAAHCYNMFAIVDMFKKVGWVTEEQRNRLWELVLSHDADEAVDGDPPMTSKPYPDFASMSGDQLWLKIADYVDPYFYALDLSLKHGNRDYDFVANQYRRRLIDAFEELTARSLDHGVAQGEIEQEAYETYMCEIMQWHTELAPYVHEATYDNN